MAATDARKLIKPTARTPIHIRPARLDDLNSIDELQKRHSRMLGFMHRRTMEAYVASGEILIVETPAPSGTDGSAMSGVSGVLLGYCMGRDRYFKREDVGIIYQLVVEPGERRSLIGATLVQAMFERAAYGCKLFCCWCAQDLPANRFWEAIGFVPLAFRTGSERSSRIHIFWQKRIREGDAETPWWYPSQTSGGSIREDRLVLPIPPGTHWSDAKPMVLPGVDPFVDAEDGADASPEGSRERRSRRLRTPKLSAKEKRARQSGGLWFAPSPEEQREEQAKAKKARPRRPKRIYNPQYVAAARDLCARYLEEVQAGRLLPEADCAGVEKYEVSRALGERGAREASQLRLAG